MNKADLIQKIKQLEGLTQEERSTLIELVNIKKKYGLVWEDKPEKVEEQLRSQLPVLREVVEKRIRAGEKEAGKEDEHFKVMPLKVEAPDTLFPEMEKKEKANEKRTETGKAPNHILIEGDNLHALTALTFTHEGKIDVIYIDPPYNTGNKDFKYNDSFVDKEDSYRHSKWLSFMDKRLRIAKRLLSEKGVIFISIDDYEQATLKMLCDEIFTEMNFVGNVIWQRAYAPINLKKTISQNHDFVLIYCKQDFQNLELNKLPRKDKQTAMYKNYDNDIRGDWKSDNLSVGPPIEKNIYPIITPSGREVYPPKGYSWRLSKERLQEFITDNRIWFGKDGNNVPSIKRFLSEVKEGVVAMSLWTYDEVGHTQDAKKELKDILHENEKPFETVKPIRLIDRILRLTTDNKRPYTILDFFAGSGTTLHTTMQLNAEDGGNRQCILVTNNENNICEEVTYERNRRVIQGYTNSKGQWVEGLTNNNLRYYRSDFVGREPSLKNKRDLTRLATELLCIKEDCYEEKVLNLDFVFSSDRKNISYFEEKDKRMVVVYDDSAIESAVDLIKFIIARNQVKENGIKVYVFSPGQYPFTEEFEEVLSFITLCALPDALSKAYLNVLPKKSRPVAPHFEEEAEVENSEPELFD